MQALYKTNALEFDFVFFNNLNYLLERYMMLNKMPYTVKTMLGQLTSEVVRKKYLLKEFLNKEVCEIIQNCISESDKKIRLENYGLLTKEVYTISGGF